MRMKIPITGTVKQIEPCIIGDKADGIGIININLGNVAWTLINLDLDAEEMEIEVTPSEFVDEDTGGVDANNEPIWNRRSSTAQEKAQFLEHARNHSLEHMSKQALYDLSKSPRLKNPFTKGADGTWNR